MRASISLHALVYIILALATLVLAGSLAYYVGISAEQSSDVSCATSVNTARLSAASGINQPLIGCDTKIRNVDSGNVKKVRNTMVSDYLWCKQSFSPGNQRKLFTGSATFCHVCALYRPEDAVEIPGFFSSLAKADPNEGMVEPGQIIPTLTQYSVIEDPALSFDRPIAILFYQSQDYASFVDALLDDPVNALGVGGGAGGVVGLGVGVGYAQAYGLGIVASSGVGTVGLVAGAAAVGVSLWVYSWFYDADFDVYSAMIITPYHEQTLNGLGCTTQTTAQPRG